MTQGEVDKAIRETIGPADRTTALYRIFALSLILLNALLNYADIGGECVVEPNNEEALWEVVVRVDGSDIALATAFERTDGKFDVVMGIVDSSVRSEVAELVLYTSKLIRTAHFSESGDAFHASGSGGNETGTFPF